MADIRPIQGAIPNLESLTNTDSFFDSVKVHFPRYWESGHFQEFEDKAYFVYEQKIRGIKRIGLIASIEIYEYLIGNILRHEHTLEAKRAYMMKLFEERQAHIKPTLLTYPKVDGINEILKSSRTEENFCYSTIYKDTKHSIWKISDKQTIQKITSIFQDKIHKVYIADGHHRTATAAILYQQMRDGKKEANGKNYNHLLAAFFSSDQLDIHEFNRVVSTLNNYSPKGFRAELRKHFIVEKKQNPFQPKQPNEIGMFIEKKWYKITPKDNFLKRFTKEEDKLAVSWLNDIVLKKILKIEDVRADQRIEYVEGPKGLKALERKVGRNMQAVAFSLYPIQFDILTKVADQEGIMPPKSTWFEPRLRNGMVITRF